MISYYVVLIMIPCGYMFVYAYNGAETNILFQVSEETNVFYDTIPFRPTT